ncbi:GGDEF domain-containing protein [Nitratireductor pacificus]|uniref:diguanylate cyclase n=1 Tax=Nitratireductor pacificus pht-3B TaxID=391937 RepID=K2MR34_9HYPH|nr:GGDEF domain-containing protein [Nitratireductor pacificus]EKF19827.1 diguanylate cyclase [Nitratireductor pacificus pht-3B]
MRALFDRFYKLRLWAQALIVTAFAVASADLLTLFFYAIFFSDRLALDIVLTAIITVLVAYPTSYVFLSKTATVARLAAELDKAATTDFLTGLRNRRDFMQAAQDEIDRTDGSAGAVLFVDIDHFKQINDQFGHAEGDRVLVLVAEAIRASVRETDIAARVGGEEFAIFMPGADLPTARRVSERIWLNCRLVARGTDRGGITTTVSIGLSLHRVSQSLDDLLKEADSLLYKAKKAGRDRVVHTLPHEVVA